MNNKKFYRQPEKKTMRRKYDTSDSRILIRDQRGQKEVVPYFYILKEIPIANLK